MQRILQTGVPQIGKKTPWSSTIIANRTPIFINGRLQGWWVSFRIYPNMKESWRNWRFTKGSIRNWDATIESSMMAYILPDGHANTLRVNKAYERISGLKRDWSRRSQHERIGGRRVYQPVRKPWGSELREPWPSARDYSQSGKKRVIVTGKPNFRTKGKNELSVVYECPGISLNSRT